MKRNASALCLLLVSILFFSASSGSAAEPAAGTWELGVILGEPTGVSAKYWMSRINALNFGAAWSFEGEGQFHLHCDYLFHNYEFFKVDQGVFPIYFGIGGRVRFDEGDSRLGLRIVFGAEYITDAYPMSVFFEVAPIVDFAPETEASINGGIGIRYVF
ncbi:MAG: hypothetical protein ABIN58_13405 [candidate division WOR-3 bacterium]